MSRDEVSGIGYSQKEVAGISQGRDGDTCPGNLETESERERRCTRCGRKGHYRTSSVYHPAVRS